MPSKAYILVHAEHKQDVVIEIRRLAGVLEAHAIHKGLFDVIVEIDPAIVPDISQFAMDEIHRIPGVRKTDICVTF